MHIPLHHPFRVVKGIHGYAIIRSHYSLDCLYYHYLPKMSDINPGGEGKTGALNTLLPYYFILMCFLLLP